jgi:hypothetical protein
MDAYRAQLESGIREYKTLDQFFEDIVVQRGEGLYFDTKDDVDRQIAAATATGNTFLVSQLEDQWAAVKENILGTNPLLAAKFAEYATSGVARERTVAQLNALLADPQAVTAVGPQAGGIAQMLLAQRQYEAPRRLRRAWLPGHHQAGRRQARLRGGHRGRGGSLPRPRGPRPRSLPRAQLMEALNG